MNPLPALLSVRKFLASSRGLISFINPRQLQMFFGTARIVVIALCSSIFVPMTMAQWNPLNPVRSVSQQEDGAELVLQSGNLRLQICSDSIIHVILSPAGPAARLENLAVIKDKWAPVNWKFESGDDVITLTTAQVKVTVQRKDSAVTFSDLSGQKLFEQSEASLNPVVVNGENTYHSELYSKLWGSYEAFYGLGQHQSGVWNYRGEAVDISQDNTNISIPFFLSSKGYGIFWNNASNPFLKQ